MFTSHTQTNPLYWALIPCEAAYGYWPGLKIEMIKYSTIAPIASFLRPLYNPIGKVHDVKLVFLGTETAREETTFFLGNKIQTEKM